ncbi:MAG: NAD(+) kinase [Gammaproteobacteria bacterium]|nr:NAD(+) kinase [Gammaproteobacteria bacterium]MYD81244.1 NAD(+) kinase [Gammaproteobacteria bacterium]
MTKNDFSVVGLVGRHDKPMIADSLHTVLEVLHAADRTVLIEQQTASLIPTVIDEVITRSDLERCDLVVVVGGDGSILGVARDLAHTNVPVLGVNRGGLGFLADISPDQIESRLNDVLAGQFRLEIHFLLEHKVVREGKVVHSSPALNDVVVNSGSITRMMDFELYVNDEFVYEQRSDGLIVSTPTGSTAYALSAGGPIMHPTLNALAIVPMFPHTLTSRPLVIGGDSKVSVMINAENQYPLVSADSQVSYVLHPRDEVHIQKFPHGLNIAYPSTHSFYEACRSKLDWGSRLGGSGTQ